MADPVRQLHRAAMYDDTTRIEELLATGVDVNATDRSGKTALHKAASLDRRNVIRLLKEQGADMDARDQDGNTPLHAAASRCGRGAMQHLTELGARTGMLNRAGATPNEVFATACRRPSPVPVEPDLETQLFTAARTGNAEKVRELLDRGVPVTITETRMNTPLHMAKNREVVRTLLDAGAEIEARNQLGYTPLNEAANDLTRSEAALALLDAGANPNVAAIYAYGDMETPLVTAIRTRNARLVDALLKRGFKIEMTPEALHNAAETEKNHDVIRVLARAGLDVNKRNPQQEAPLHVAAKLNYLFNLVELLTRGADPNLRDIAGKTPLHLAAERGYPRVIKALLLPRWQPRADINAVDRAGNTPLHLARDAATAQLLLEAGANPFARAGDRKLTPLDIARRRSSGLPTDLVQTLEQAMSKKLFKTEAPAPATRPTAIPENPLHRAINTGNLEIVKEILRIRPTLLDARDGSGRTPLHVAAAGGHTAIVKELLAAGAEIAEDNNLQTPLHVAANAPIVNALLAAGADLNATDAQTRLPSKTVKTAEARGALLRAKLERQQRMRAPAVRAGQVE